MVRLSGRKHSRTLRGGQSVSKVMSKEKREIIGASLLLLQHVMPIASDVRENESGASMGIDAQLMKNYSYTKET